jgi:hypothetical protein
MISDFLMLQENDLTIIIDKTKRKGNIEWKDIAISKVKRNSHRFKNIKQFRRCFIFWRKEALLFDLKRFKQRFEPPQS